MKPPEARSESERNFAVHIVAYRAPEKLDACLRSVCRFLPDAAIHVWDNSGSSFPGVRRLAESYPEVDWHFGEQNIGFAAAVNKLAALAPGKDLLLLNPDAELLGPLTRTLEALRAPGIAAAAPMDTGTGFEGRSRSSRPWDIAHRRETIVSAVGGAAGLGQRLRGSPLSNLYRSQPKEVSGYLTGACLAIRRDAWESVGPFDEEFFLYGEEADWQRRAHAKGWRIVLADEIGFHHSALGTVADDAPRARRSWDLYRAAVALSIEHNRGMWASDLYLALCALLDAGRCRLRRSSGNSARRSDFLVTVDGPGDSAGAGITIAEALSCAGYSVTVVSLQRLGRLPGDLSPAIRLIRGPWWWPSAAPERLPPALVVGVTKRERAFGWLYGLLCGRLRLTQAEARALCATPRRFTN